MLGECQECGYETALCSRCGNCIECCDCVDGSSDFDRDELGLNPEEDDDAADQLLEPDDGEPAGL